MQAAELKSYLPEKPGQVLTVGVADKQLIDLRDCLQQIAVKYFDFTPIPVISTTLTRQAVEEDNPETVTELSVPLYTQIDDSRLFFSKK